MKFTTVETILSKLYAELRGTSLNESDIINWIGEAMDFLNVKETHEEAVAFLKVENYSACVPYNFQMALQLARYKKDIITKECEIDEEEEKEEYVPPIKDCDIDCSSIVDITESLFGVLDTSYRPYFDMQWQYIPWSTSAFRQQSFSPIRLSNHTFFNSLVCEEKNLYHNCVDEYTIVGTVERKFRFSFKEGYVALSYIKSAVDDETGYPLIPDNIRHITAINYYIRWKIAERKTWMGREGFGRISQMEEQHWLKYVKQAKNNAKMPKTLDDFQDLLEQTHQMIPKQNRYYGFFGNLNKSDQREYSGPMTNHKHR